jgi:hypothetical protein
VRSRLDRSLAWLEARAPWLVAALAAGLFVAGSLYAVRLGPELPYWDEREYVELAEGLLERGEFGLAGDRAFRPPLYPALLALLLQLGASVTVLRVANFALLAGSAVLLYALARRTSGLRLGGLLAAAGILGYPVLVYAAGKLYPQTLAGFLWLLALLLLLRPAPLPTRRALAAGLTYGLLVLTVPTFLPLLGLLLLWSLWQAGWRALRPGVLVVAATLAVMAPWTLRNDAVLGHWVPVSTNSGVNLLLGNSEHARPELGTNVDISRYHEQAAGLGEVERDRVYRDAALAWIRENPRAALELYAAKCLQYFAFSEQLATAQEASSLRTLLMAATYLPLLALALGPLGLRRRQASAAELALAGLYLANGLLMAVFFTRIRFRLPLDLMLLALAGGAVARLLVTRQRPEPR